MTILFSIPVHEKPDVILDQINNFKKYNPESAFILHVSKGFYEKYSDESFANTKDVYINPEHLETIWGDIINTHLSNFKYAYKNIDFNYFVMHSSNDMYIKKGFSDYICNYDAGFNIRKVLNKNSHWWPGNAALLDYELKNIMIECGQTMVVASQVESSFYKRDLMKKITDVICKHYKEDKDKVKYTREEIYFSTVASSMIDWSTIGNPTTFSEVHRFDRTLWKIRNITRTIHNFLLCRILMPQKLYEKFESLYNIVLFKSKFYKTTKSVIDKLIMNKTKYIDKHSLLDDGSGEFYLYDHNIFSVKRIERNYNDSVRKYIRRLK